MRMNTPSTFTCCSLASASLIVLACAVANATVTMNWANVDYLGNAPDTNGFGSVNTRYRIAKEEVTNAQYAEFLNEADPFGVNPNGIYNSFMAIDVRGGLFFDSSNAPGSKYVVKTNMANKPVVYVNWRDAARFVNWLNNGQGSADTESGAYDMTIAAPERLIGARVFLPSENEWYKAAFHDPVNDGADVLGTVDYWLFPTMSDDIPTVGSASAIGAINNPGTNVANYDFGADWNGKDGNLTTVGSATSTSFYGTFDMAGNVWEWNESITLAFPGDPAPTRGLAGGSWINRHGPLRSLGALGTNDPTAEVPNIGFRVASIPEPSSGSLAAIAIVVLGLGRRHRRDS